ncbi:HIT domain-containing protein [Candidatus Desantisbacteria bacterium]|nr:HIT domain-containing protein [Candidatus Desantisbacteria bacterium]
MHLFVPSKLENYLLGEKPKVDCILCAIRDRDEKIVQFDIYRSQDMIVSLNLYPYNPGHVMIFPNRHIKDIRELNEEETSQIQELTIKTLDILDKLYSPFGYNIGYNMGTIAGASIEHLHLHIVPRYKNELGFVDILSNSKIIVEDPRKTLERLREEFVVTRFSGWS